MKGTAEIRRGKVIVPNGMRYGISICVMLTIISSFTEQYSINNDLLDDLVSLLKMDGSYTDRVMNYINQYAGKDVCVNTDLGLLIHQALNKAKEYSEKSDKIVYRPFVDIIDDRVTDIKNYSMVYNIARDF